MSLSKKTRKSNNLQMSLQRQHFLLSYLKTNLANLANCVGGFSLLLATLSLFFFILLCMHGQVMDRLFALVDPLLSKSGCFYVVTVAENKPGTVLECLGHFDKNSTRF